ncbi:MAG: porin family protein [Deltaproteobacteria bacterium]|nr:porin family protein [Deltaproteobacteria bacterium]
MKKLTKECRWIKLLGTVVFSLAVFTMSAGPAQAQGVGQKGLSGFYVGALIGYATGEYSSDMSEQVDHEPTGGLLGVQMGWSLSSGPMIFGIDADIARTNIEGEDSITMMGYKSDVSHDINYLGTVRGRVGFMAGPVLIYGTAGLAMADLDNKIVVSYNGQLIGSDEQDSWHTGWTVGAGIEYPITPNFSVGAEYLYIDMGREEVTMNIGGYPATDKGDLNLNVARLGFKFRF